jgi:outer membrane PBP1 activator LpoA protein
MRLPNFFFLLALFAAACGGPTREATTPSDATLESQAQAYLAAGNYTAAAEEYIHLAEKNKKYADPYLLKATSAYLGGNNPDLAEGTLAKVREKNLTDIQSTERKILLARIALARNSTDSALHLLDFELPPDTPRALSADYYINRARAEELRGQLFNAAGTRVQLAGYLDTDEDRNNNNHAIWDLLLKISVDDLHKELTGAGSELAGWLDLAIIYETYISSQTDMNTAINVWQQTYGSHPAAAQIVPELLAKAAASSIQPHQIALLLPFNSQYQDAAAAIRDGFLAAWYESPATTDKPVIKIYNTASQDILDVYNKAVADGADFMVGPLEKEAVTSLLAAGNLTVRILALNQVSTTQEQKTGDAPAGLPSIFQFGLLPEEGAQQAAERAWFNGLANALVITPDTTWGERIYNAFSTRWQKLGGKIIEHVSIPDGAEDLSVPVKQLLNIDSSERRAKELTRVLGRKIHTEPRHRQDADLVFLAALPQMARQLIPQFRFFGVDNIPIYSGSSVYSGILNPGADSDINGVIFPDMPWLVDTDQEQSPLQQALDRNWQQDQSPYKRLYAFGIDAYRVIPKLAELFLQKNSKFSGVTGTLSVTGDGLVQRTSTWVQMVNGTPRLLDGMQTTR